MVRGQWCARSVAKRRVRVVLRMEENIVSRLRNDLARSMDRLVTGDDFDKRAIVMIDQLNDLQQEMEEAEDEIDSMSTAQAEARLSKLRNKYNRLLKKYNKMIKKECGGTEMCDVFGGK